MPIIFLLILSCTFMVACNNEEDAAKVTETGGSISSDNENDFENYIHAALDAVDKPSDDENSGKSDADNAPNAKVIQLADNNDDIMISAQEQLPEDSGIIPDFSPEEPEKSDSGTSVESSELSPTDTPEITPAPTGTPETFDVGTCCIYIKCESDSGYGSEIVTLINQARTELGYPELNENAGLVTCADRRTREVYTKFSHTRPNNQPFYSLAPEYFKAEMMAVDDSEAEKTFDALMTDPVSRNLIFTTKYTSVGASCIKCNGLYSVVVAFGD